MREARIVARLDHPHIVPVYHVGSSHETPAFIVTKYIDGCSLAERLLQSPFPQADAIALVINVAEALDYAHRSRDEIVHRDIKPANLLLDQHGKVYVADFGLAVREAELEEADRGAGTPADMSPEQARGEGHRIDGRSDIFSLGIVLYELLTGRRPFRAQDFQELRAQITQGDPKPPRQINTAVSPELERICLKALSKLATERYGTARDLAADLRLRQATEFLGGSGLGASPGLATPLSAPTSLTPTRLTPAGASGSTGMACGSSGVRIVPKGLRSFDAGDAGFFPELLPGARDQGGEDALLTQALRQCDGERLQCLLLVRDDYALGVSRFPRLLEIHLVHRSNNPVVDRF